MTKDWSMLLRDTAGVVNATARVTLVSFLAVVGSAGHHIECMAAH